MTTRPSFAVGIARVALVLTSIGAACAFVFLALTAASAGVIVTDVPVAVASGTAGFGEVLSGKALVLLTPAPTSARVASVAGPMMLAVVVLNGARLLESLLREISEGRPFTRSNVRRLRILGGLLLAWAAVVPQLVALGRYLALGDHANGFSFAVEWVPLVMAGVAFAAASAFERGRALEDDVEGLV